MGLEQDIHLLSQLELFEGFTDEHLRLLAFGALKSDLDTGQVLFEENALTDGGYVVMEGRIDLLKSAGQHSELVGSISVGGLVGELALVTETRRMVLAKAGAPTKLLRIPRVLFRRVLEEFPELAVLLHQRISKSVNGLVEQLDAVGGRISSSKF